MELVNHLFLTPRFLVKGRVATGDQRLSTFLGSYRRAFLTVEDVTLVAIHSPEKTRTGRIELRASDVVLAHEFLDLQRDEHRRTLATQDQAARDTFSLYLREPMGCELLGRVREDALASAQQSEFCVVTQVEVRGLEHASGSEFEKIRKLSYAILNRSFIHCHFKYE